MSAILFGSISTIADTSELQRTAFNDAFQVHGLDWEWSREDYLALLTQSGGEKRIAEHAWSVGQDVDAAAIHATKSELFQESLSASDLQARPGVMETIRDGKGSGFKIGLVTTTSEANVASLVRAVGPDVQESDFDVIVDSSKVDRSKPDGAAYLFALATLGEEPANCTAVEDNLGGVESAQAAGLTCSAFPNENTATHDFGEADHLVDHLSFAELRTLVPSA